jgi:hypothetical protein
MTIRKWAYEKPKGPYKKRTGAKGVVDSVAIVGTKIGQWTVRPSIHAYDAGRGEKFRK